MGAQDSGPGALRYWLDIPVPFLPWSEDNVEVGNDLVPPCQVWYLLCEFSVWTKQEDFVL